MGRGEDINILWCSKKWDLEKLCSLVGVGIYLLGVGSAPKNKICSEVGFVGVGRGEGGSLRKYLLDCPQKVRLGRDSLCRCGKRRGRVGLSHTEGSPSSEGVGIAAKLRQFSKSYKSARVFRSAYCIVHSA